VKVPPTHRPYHRPPANLVGDAFGKRRPVGRCGHCGGGSVTAGTTGWGGDFSLHWKWKAVSPSPPFF